MTQESQVSNKFLLLFVNIYMALTLTELCFLTKDNDFHSVFVRSPRTEGPDPSHFSYSLNTKAMTVVSSRSTRITVLSEEYKVR